MKFRLTLLVVSLSLVLAACSLAEDITPPANYVSPTVLPTTVPPTQTPVPSVTAKPTSTSEVVATFVDLTPSATDATQVPVGSTTPAADISPTPQPALLTVEGTVSGFFNSIVPNGIEASLLLYDTTASAVSQTLTTPIHPDGTYKFDAVLADNKMIYLVTVTYKDVTYESNYTQFDGTTTQFNIPVTVYNSTTDLTVLTVAQAHLQFDFSTAGQVSVMSLYVVTNSNASAVVVTSDGSTVPFIQIPTGATNVQYQLASSSSPLVNATNGFALLPGTDKQYGIIASFVLPYTNNKLSFAQPFNLPVTAATIIVPEGVKVKSDQLTDGGTQNSTSTPPVTYHLYQASNLASGTTLTATISGKPGDKVSTGFVLDQNTWLIIGIGAVGLILVALGIFLFIRDRKLRKMEEEEDLEESSDQNPLENGKDALGNDRLSIMDAIIALDDQFQSGDISKEAYDQRRAELKDRLKNLPQ